MQTGWIAMSAHCLSGEGHVSPFKKEEGGGALASTLSQDAFTLADVHGMATIPSLTFESSVHEHHNF